MANTSSRTLRLLSLLEARRYWAGSELAERLEVSLRTLRRDVDRLRELGYPVEAHRGIDGGYELAPGASLPPLVLDDEEAVALVASLITTVQSPVAADAEASLRALGKVVQVMPKRLRLRAEAIRSVTDFTRGAPRTSFDAETLTAVAQACRDGEHLEFAYVAADRARSERRVEPRRLVALGRTWYLVAYDLDRAAWRSFRLDRIAAPRTTGGRFATRELPATDAATFVRAGIAEAPRSFDARAIVAAPGATVRERIGRWVHVEDWTEHTCIVRIRTESLDEAVVALVMARAEFTVQSPADLVEHLRAAADRLARAAEHSAPAN